VVPVAGARVAGPLAVTLLAVERTRDEAVCRLGFSALTTQDYVALSGLMYGEAEAMRRFQMRRRRHKDLFTGTLQFVWWGLAEPVRALRYAFLPKRRPAPADAPAASPTRPRETARLGLRSPGPDHDPFGTTANPTGPAPIRPAPAAAAGANDEGAGDWVRLMLEFENERRLSGGRADRRKPVAS
jgi:cellulose synthase (UDP-forming)